MEQFYNYLEVYTGGARNTKTLDCCGIFNEISDFLEAKKLFERWFSFFAIVDDFSIKGGVRYAIMV